MKPVLSFAEGRALGCLLLCGCVTTAPAPEVVSRPEPAMVCEPTRVPPVGWSELPSALAVDPKKVPIPPLALSVIKPVKTALPNGLVVYALEDHAAPLVSVRALIWAGQYDDPAPKLGIASLTADLATSGGAGPLTAEQVDELLEFHAADISGGAADEYSQVSLSVRAEDLARLFPVFADVLQRPRFQQDRFDVAVAANIEGIRRRPDRPDGLAARALNKAVFGPTTLLGRETTEATLKAITPADLKAFAARAYSPKATALLVSGDFDPALLTQLVKTHLGSWKGGERVARIYPADPKLERRVILVPKATAQAKVRIGGHGYPRRSPDEYAMRLVNTTLGAFGVGRLYKEIRDAKGLAYSASSSVSPGPTTGLFTANFDTRPEQVPQALDAALKILEAEATVSPPTTPELRQAADMTINSFAFRFDHVSKIVFEKALFDMFGYPEDYLDRYRENVSKVDGPAASEAVKKLARLQTLQIVIVGPPDKMGDLSRFGPVTTITDVEQFR
ncbi:MAG: zinc-dependent peptidase, family [Myxococcaceae bacterium]|nr:zinc-dependent peptidase, family [Myxococcaceae bacterium]